jgi:voltage-gated sodium channel
MQSSVETGVAVVKDDMANEIREDDMKRARARKRKGKDPALMHWYEKLQNSPIFDNFILSVICLNALWIGADVDMYADEPAKVGNVPWVVENLFCLVFTFEILVRFLNYDRLFKFFTDPLMRRWNIFDFVLVVIMIAEVWVMYYLMNGQGGLKMLSVLRLLRLLRISRLFRLIPELRMMVMSLAAAMRSVSLTLFMLVILMYVFSIIFTQWAHGNDDFDLHFGSLGSSFISLMQILVFDDTFDLIRNVKGTSQGMAILLILFMCVGGFTLLNMLIGIICEIVSETKRIESEKSFITDVRAIFEEVDADGSGTITREEFLAGADVMKEWGVTEETVESCFDFLDVDDSGELDMEEFTSILYKLTHEPDAADIMVISANVMKIADALGIEVLAPPHKVFTGNSIQSIFPKTEKKAKSNGEDDASKAPESSPQVSQAQQVELAQIRSAVSESVHELKSDMQALKVTMAAIQTTLVSGNGAPAAARE